MELVANMALDNDRGVDLRDPALILTDLAKNEASAIYVDMESVNTDQTCTFSLTVTNFLNVSSETESWEVTRTALDEPLISIVYGSLTPWTRHRVRFEFVIGVVF